MQPTNMHISQLLYEHDCLIVPGLGAFVASRVPATIDRKRGIMLPPRKEIVFNKNISHNDGLLVAYIAELHHVSTDIANSMIATWVAEINMQLQQKHSAQIDGIGILKLMGANVMLVQDKSNNYLADSYGFSQQAISIVSTKTIISDQFVHNIRNVAASVAVLVGLLMISPETHDTKIVGEYTQAGVVANLFSTTNTQVTTESETTERQRIATPTEVYHIIVASFPNEYEADAYIKTMHNKGIDGLEKIASDKRIRISAGEFADYNVAIRNNRTFRNISGFENAWILKEKK